MMNVLESLSGSVGKELVGQASRFLGENPDVMQKAAGTAFSSLLTGMMQKASTQQGAADLFKTINGPSVDTNLLGDLGGLFGGGERTTSLLGAGASLLAALFGSADKVTALVNALASAVGIKPSSATSLLGMAAPLMMGFLKKQVGSGNLDAGGLAGMLMGQRGFLEKSGLDTGIAKVLGIGNLSSFLTGLPAAGAAAAAAAGRAANEAAGAAKSAGREGASLFGRLWPWLLGALVLFLVWQWFSGSRTEAPPAPAPVPQTTMPEAVVPEATAPTAAPIDMATPAADVLGNVYFDTNSAVVSAEGEATVEEVAMRAHTEGFTVAVTGYTDRSGDAEVNDEIARNRAFAVRDALVAAGLSESSIVLDEPVFVEGGSQDDPEARRVVLSRRM